MQKFPLRMKDNDLLVTELYRDPNSDPVTAISVYLTPKTSKILSLFSNTCMWNAFNVNFFHHLPSIKLTVKPCVSCQLRNEVGKVCYTLIFFSCTTLQKKKTNNIEQHVAACFFTAHTLLCVNFAGMPTQGHRFVFVF